MVQRLKRKGHRASRPKDGSLVIRFEEGRSSSFLRALELCAGLQHFEEYLIGKKRHFVLSLTKRSLHHALPALRHIKKLKSKQVLVNGNEVGWEQVFRFHPCYERYLKAKKGRKFCYGLNDDDANLWGCIHTLDVEYTTHGELDLRTHHWTWNKDSLKSALNAAACEHCPSHRLDHKEIVDALPDRVHPETEQGYSFDILTIPSKVRRTYTISTGCWNDAHVSGVRITGVEAVNELRRKSKKPISPSVLKNQIIFGYLGEF